MNILVTGANGYVGAHLLAYLVKQGHEVWGVVRPNCPAGDLEPLKDVGVRVVFNDMEGNRRLDLEPGTAGAVIHLLGSLQAPPLGTYRSVHENKTRFLTSECRRLGIKKIVYLGSLGAGPNAVSEYLRTKWLAEQEIQSAGVDYVIVRSPLIFGKSFGLRESKVLARLKEAIKTRPRIPILGSGKNLLQPIYIGDLVRCLEKAVADVSLRNEAIDLGGPERLTFEQVVDAIAANLGIQKPKIRVPYYPALAIAYCAERFRPNPLITMDQVRMMRDDYVCQPERMNQLFGPARTRLKDGL